MTNTWYKYTSGSYKKKMYDIKLHTGVIFTACWPNAGKFLCGNIGEFDESLVSEIRESIDTKPRCISNDG
jgi:hypothetical protein